MLSSAFGNEFASFIGIAASHDLLAQMETEVQCLRTSDTFDICLVLRT